MYLMVSVTQDNFKEVSESLSPLREQANHAPGLGGVERSDAFKRSNGAMLLIDWKRQEILASIQLPKVMGFLLEEDKLRFCSWADDAIYTLEGSECTNKIMHPWCNHPHSIYKTQDGYLISSSATDFVMEVDSDGKVLWEFLFTEHGYPLSGGRWCCLMKFLALLSVFH